MKDETEPAVRASGEPQKNPVLLRERVAWYRSAARPVDELPDDGDGGEPTQDYVQSGDLAGDAADDLQAALDANRTLTAAASPSDGGARQPQEELALNMTDVYRLLAWANRFEAHGPDMRQWGNVAFIIETLREIASKMEQGISGVGEQLQPAADSDDGSTRPPQGKLDLAAIKTRHAEDYMRFPDHVTGPHMMRTDRAALIAEVDALRSASLRPAADFWRCNACGCLWRDNHDETVSLSSAKQTSCPKCEMNPTSQECEPLFRGRSTSLRETAPTAGDLLIAATDKWAQHAMTCDLEECEPCIVAINQLRLAYKVWQSSAHKSAKLSAIASSPAPPETQP